MTAAEPFPLEWERTLWAGAPGFPASLAHRGTEYAVTNIRVVVRERGATMQEMTLDEVDTVSVTASCWQRAAGTSTLVIRSRRGGHVVRFANIRHGHQLALVLQLHATDLFDEDAGGGIDAALFRGAVGVDSQTFLESHRIVLLTAATAVFAVVFVGAGLARQDSLAAVVFADDDPIAPAGRRRATSEIVRFMEREVMPFAKVALAPLAGGADAVTCETCHGPDGEARAWKMPGVRALPEPELRFGGLERAGRPLDAQMRNAVYGYLAEENKQTIAAYMRREVMPGMARIMRRPAYDFAKSYSYNRSQRAVGCYHCHLVE